MTEMTIAETRNNLSAIVNALADGKNDVHVIYNRSKPVARIVPIEEPRRPIRIGIAKDDGLVFDDELFDALDAEIAEDFGV